MNLNDPKYQKETTVAQRIAAQLVINEPFWAEMFYSMYTFEMPPGMLGGMPDTLATDGQNMWISPAYWKELQALPNGKALQKSAIAHEICHKMLNHCTRRGDRDPMLWNGAADECVNEMLVDNGFPLRDTWVQPVPARRGWSVERRYNAILKEIEQQQPKGGGGKGGKGAAGEPLEGEGGDGEGSEGYGDSPAVPKSWKEAWQDVIQQQGSPEQLAKAEQQVERAIGKALATARAVGKVPAGVEQAMTFAFAPAEEPWYNHLHRYMQALANSEYNWARVNKRQLVTQRIFAPDHFSEALGPVVVFRDTSGSCYNAMTQHKIMAHVQAIMAEAKPERLLLVDFDAAVHHASEFDRGDEHIQMNPQGGGGTDFRPLFTHLEKHGLNPSVVLIITDMWGTFPERDPGYPVVWVSTEGIDKAPFGEVICVR